MADIVAARNIATFLRQRRTWRCFFVGAIVGFACCYLIAGLLIYNMALAIRWTPEEALPRAALWMSTLSTSRQRLDEKLKGHPGTISIRVQP